MEMRSYLATQMLLVQKCLRRLPGTVEFPAQMASNAENVCPFDDVTMDHAIASYQMAFEKLYYIDVIVDRWSKIDL